MARRRPPLGVPSSSSEEARSTGITSNSSDSSDSACLAFLLLLLLWDGAAALALAFFPPLAPLPLPLRYRGV